MIPLALDGAPMREGSIACNGVDWRCIHLVFVDQIVGDESYVTHLPVCLNTNTVRDGRGWTDPITENHRSFFISCHRCLENKTFPTCSSISQTIGSIVSSSLSNLRLKIPVHLFKFRSLPCVFYIDDTCQQKWRLVTSSTREWKNEDHSADCFCSSSTI